MKKTLLALALTACLSASSQAAVSYQTITNAVSSSGVNYVFNKFNEQYGTLTGVTFSIVSSIDSGSFNVLNSAATSARVRAPFDSLSVYDNQGSGGDYLGSVINFTTTPSTAGAGATLASGAKQTYALVSNSLSGGVSQDFDLSAFLASYQSVNGSDNVSFSAFNGPNTTVSGGNYTLNSTQWLNSTVLTLTYDYTTAPAAVPEPSQVAASLLLIGGIAGFVIVRRRKNASALIA